MAAEEEQGQEVMYPGGQNPGWWTPSYPLQDAGSYRNEAGRKHVQALRQWQCDLMQYSNFVRWSQTMLPYSMSCMYFQQMYLQQQAQNQDRLRQTEHQLGRAQGRNAPANLWNRIQQAMGAQQQPRPAAVPQAQQNVVRQNRPDVQVPQPNAILNGHEFIVPHLWKRLCAECIDFFFLFMIKLGITLLTVEYIGALDIEKYDIELFFNQSIDYETAFAMTYELIIMEIMNRVFICIFETLCLQKGIANQLGGATPGKRIMGLRVISCMDLVEVGQNKVRVAPARSIGYTNAFIRSVIKNFSLAFFFPACFTVFFFQHNRAAYDIIANCMVVELTENDLRMGR